MKRDLANDDKKRSKPLTTEDRKFMDAVAKKARRRQIQDPKSTAYNIARALAMKAKEERDNG